jgi:hypothetical protein
MHLSRSGCIEIDTLPNISYRARRRAATGPSHPASSPRGITHDGASAAPTFSTSTRIAFFFFGASLGSLVRRGLID